MRRSILGSLVRVFIEPTSHPFLIDSPCFEGVTPIFVYAVINLAFFGLLMAMRKLFGLGSKVESATLESPFAEQQAKQDHVRIEMEEGSKQSEAPPLE